MSRLSLELYNRCRATLLKCGEFDRDASLRTVFITDDLYSFRDRLPSADNKAARVDAVLDYLLEQQISGGLSSLPAFLYALRDRYQPGDALRDELAALAQDTRSHLTPSDVASSEGASSSDPRAQGTTYITHINHAEGLAIGDGAQVIRPGSPQAAAPPGVDVTLLTEIVPTAFCHQLDVEAFRLVTVILDNTGQGCANADLRVRAAIEDYSDVAVASPRVRQGEQVRVSLLPVLKPAAVATLNDIQPVTLRVTVEQTDPVERTLYDQTRRIKLHARDTTLLAVKLPDGSFIDLTDYLAAWVTPRHAEIERLLRRAAERRPDRQFGGYQGATTLPQGADVVRAQARAIFTALKEDVSLTYINSPLNLGKQEGQITQRVRLPSESLAAGGSANCIDGTVLFASLLELASIQPLIVVVPGHAFLGWRIWKGVNQYEFLETTMIGSNDFADAQQTAQARYDDALMRGYFSRGLFDPGGFARLVDVAACRAKSIDPLE
jgi:hypothetical protein